MDPVSVLELACLWSEPLVGPVGALGLAARICLNPTIPWGWGGGEAGCATERAPDVFLVSGKETWTLNVPALLSPQPETISDI